MLVSLQVNIDRKFQHQFPGMSITWQQTIYRGKIFTCKIIGANICQVVLFCLHVFHMILLLFQRTKIVLPLIFHDKCAWLIYYLFVFNECIILTRDLTFWLHVAHKKQIPWRKRNSQVTSQATNISLTHLFILGGCKYSVQEFCLRNMVLKI